MEEQSKSLVIIEEDEPKTTSYIVAEQLGIAHRNMVGLIKDHQERIEKHFGVLRFETSKPQVGSVGGRPEQSVILTENQAHYVLTLSRNTDKAMEVKALFVKAFAQAKQQLAQSGLDQIVALRQQVAYLVQDNADLHESCVVYLDIIEKNITMPGLSAEGLEHIESFGVTEALMRLRKALSRMEVNEEDIKEHVPSIHRNLQSLRKAVLDVCSRSVDVDTELVMVSKRFLQQEQIIARLQTDMEKLQLRGGEAIALLPEQGEE